MNKHVSNVTTNFWSCIFANADTHIPPYLLMLWGVYGVTQLFVMFGSTRFGTVGRNVARDPLARGALAS